MDIISIFFCYYCFFIQKSGMHSEEGLADHELVASLLNGSEVAFDQIYDRYWQKLYNEAYKRLNDQTLSEEIVQDVFIDLWNKRQTKDIGNLFAYLIGAVRYQVFTQYNKQKRIPLFEAPLEFMAVSSEYADSTVLREELLAGITKWLETQPEKRREICRLRYLENMSTLEIADLLEISRKTVQNQLGHSQQSLRDSISKSFLMLLLVGLP